MLMSVGLVHLNNFKSCRFCHSFHALNAQLTDDWGICKSFVIEDPYFFWQCIPWFTCFINEEFFLGFYNERFVTFWIVKLLNN